MFRTNPFVKVPQHVPEFDLYTYPNSRANPPYRFPIHQVFCDRLVTSWSPGHILVTGSQHPNFIQDQYRWCISKLLEAPLHKALKIWSETNEFGNLRRQKNLRTSCFHTSILLPEKVRQCPTTMGVP